jgi:uracil phosphoribosyltransferase
MLATGASLVKSAEHLKAAGQYTSLHIVCAIACTKGIEYVQNALPEAIIWCGAIDNQLTDKGYIVPGLGDAGDLAFGEKIQH